VPERCYAFKDSKSEFGLINLLVLKRQDTIAEIVTSRKRIMRIGIRLGVAREPISKSASAQLYNLFIVGINVPIQAFFESAAPAGRRTQFLRSRADRLAEYHPPARQRMRARDRRDVASHTRRSNARRAPHRRSPRVIHGQVRQVETRLLPRVRQE